MEPLQRGVNVEDYCKAELKASEYVGKGFSEVVECAGIQIPWGSGKGSRS